MSNDLLAGLMVAMALVPEAIAFSIITWVDPKVALYASFSIATIIALAEGRSGMVSAATGAMLLGIASLVRDHGLRYLLAATCSLACRRWLRAGCGSVRSCASSHAR